MKTRTLTLLIVASGILAVTAGCATQTTDFRIDYDNSLGTALTQLQDGRPADALMSLDSARAIAEENSYDKTTIERLVVEANLGLGNTLEAFDQAKTLLNADPKDPYANELTGKCLFASAEFTQAEGHFITAQKAYQAPADATRAQDFVAVTRYFLAYADGNLRLAEGYLREVQSPDLLHSIDKARKEVELSAAR